MVCLWRPEQFGMLWQSESFARCRKATLDQITGACLLLAGSGPMNENRE